MSTEGSTINLSGMIPPHKGKRLSLSASCAHSIQFKAGLEGPESGGLSYLLHVNRVGGQIIRDLPALQAHEVNMLGHIAFVAILCLVELQCLDYVVFGKIPQGTVDRG